MATIGSQRLLRTLVEHQPTLLLDPLRRSGALRDDETLQWMSPEPKTNYKEYRDIQALTRLGITPRVPLRMLRPHVPTRVRAAVRFPIGTQLAGVHQRARIAPVGLGAARTRGIHGREVRIRHNHFMPHRFQVPGDPLALRTRLQQYASGSIDREYRCQAFPCRCDPAFLDPAIRMADAQLGLEFVQIESYRIHCWPHGCAPQERVICCGANLPPRLRRGQPLHTNYPNWR